MECNPRHCAAAILEWLQATLASPAPTEADPSKSDPAQMTLWTLVPYDENSPAIHTSAQLDAALEHLEYAVFRRYQNQLTRAERTRLDNTIHNALFKVDRYLSDAPATQNREPAHRLQRVRAAIEEAREQHSRLQLQARRADLKIAQLSQLSPEAFEEFVAEIFEALGFAVETRGGTGDEGIDLLLTRGTLRAVVQCKYHSAPGVVGSPDLQKFLGSIHHAGCQKGFFVTTRTFSLAAERFARANPIELVDGPRLVELVHEALGPAPPEKQQLLAGFNMA